MKLFYTYTLSYPDGRVFYVGKGQGKRIHQHEWEAKNGYRSYKCNVIRKIWREGGKVVKTRVFKTRNEEDALIYEWVLINLVYGRDNLTNLTDGGEGISGLSESGRKSIAEKLTGNDHGKSNKGAYRSPEHRLAVSKAQRKITTFPLLLSPDGCTYEVESIAEFARTHGLNKSCIHDLFIGRQKTHKGWRVLEGVRYIGRTKKLCLQKSA